jgi:hypothetical protein
MNFWRKGIFVFIAPIVILVSLVGCKGMTPAPAGTSALATVQAPAETPPLQVTLPTALPAMLSILRTRIYFAGSGYQPKEMVVVEMDVPPGVEIPAVKPGEPVGVAFAEADEKGNFTAEVAAGTKIQTFLRGNILPTLAPDPKSFKPIPHGIYTFRATGAESGRSSMTRIEFVPPAKN